MYPGGDALFGHYWWLWLSVLTFLLGWWWGRHVVAHVFRETLNSQVADWTPQLAAASNELGDTRPSLEKTQDESQRQTADLVRRERELSEQKSELIALQNDFDKLKASNVKLSEDHASMSGELGAAKHTTTMQSDMDALRQERAMAEKKLEACEMATAEQVAKINALQSELSASNQAITERDAALKAREKELAQVKSLNQVVLGQMDAIEAEKAAVHTSFKVRERLFEEIKTQHEHLRNQYAALESEKTALHASLQMRETELAELKAASELESNSKPPRLGSHEAATVANHTAVPELTQTVPIGEASAPPSGRIHRDRQDETAHCANCPQHLSDVKGIGSGFETKLYAAGIGTYWDLSRLSNDEMTRILAVKEGLRKRFNFDAVRADALRLADESHTKGRSWTRSKPDDFEPLKGLGHIFEKRLYDAGICTFAALAASTPDELHDICRPPAHFKKPDYAAWIEQARTLAKR